MIPHKFGYLKRFKLCSNEKTFLSNHPSFPIKNFKYSAIQLKIRFSETINQTDTKQATSYATSHNIISHHHNPKEPKQTHLQTTNKTH